MKVLRLLYLAAARRYYRTACAHKPLHPDLPKIMLRRVELNDEWQRLMT